MRLDRRRPDSGVAARITPGLQVYREPTSITDEQIRALYDRGYSEREITDVVGVIAGETPHRPSSGRRA